MAGASKIGRTQMRSQSRPNLAGMMSFDHMDPKQVADWKVGFGKWRAGHKKRTADRTAMQARHSRGRSY
jgi:hypothetical protein